MVHDTHGLHHFHKRKRTSRKKLTPYPSPHKGKRLIDTLIYIAVFVSPIMTLPQVWKIWFEQNASGVSLISWSAYLVTNIFWLIYGITHKEKPIIISGIIWFALEIFIIIGILLYG